MFLYHLKKIVLILKCTKQRSIKVAILFLMRTNYWCSMIRGIAYKNVYTWYRSTFKYIPSFEIKRFGLILLQRLNYLSYILTLHLLSALSYYKQTLKTDITYQDSIPFQLNLLLFHSSNFLLTYVFSFPRIVTE